MSNPKSDISYKANLTTRRLSAQSSNQSLRERRRHSTTYNTKEKEPEKSQFLNEDRESASIKKPQEKIVQGTPPSSNCKYVSAKQSNVDKMTNSFGTTSEFQTDSRDYTFISNQKIASSSQAMPATIKKRFIMPQLTIVDTEGDVVDINSPLDGQQASSKKDPVCEAPNIFILRLTSPTFDRTLLFENMHCSIWASLRALPCPL